MIGKLRRVVPGTREKLECWKGILEYPGTRFPGANVPVPGPSARAGCHCRVAFKFQVLGYLGRPLPVPLLPLDF
eukprot:888985-Rhodomonas_salina.3